MVLDHDAYGRAFGDIYDSWYADLSDPAAVARHVLAHAPDRAVLELGVGTGRLSAGFRGNGESTNPLVGIDTSRSMLTQWKSAEPSARAAAADMTTLPFPGQSFGAVFVAYNTFFNLVTATEQQRCLHECARVLGEDGVLVIETFVPPAPLAGPEHAVSRSRAADDAVVLIASREEPATQTMTGAHLDFSPGGLRVRPWQIRWCSVEQLDSMADVAGFTLISRVASWDGDPFTADSERHVSTWRVDH